MTRLMFKKTLKDKGNVNLMIMKLFKVYIEALVEQLVYVFALMEQSVSAVAETQ